jgi:hypothetical protein
MVIVLLNYQRLPVKRYLIMISYQCVELLGRVKLLENHPENHPGKGKEKQLKIGWWFQPL